MTTPEDSKTPLQQAGEDLFNFAIEREDTKWLVARLPAEAEVKPATVEYELQILKIISVGWSIPYFLANWPEKQRLIELFWQAVREFSGSLSTTTEMMTGQDIDYFPGEFNVLGHYGTESTDLYLTDLGINVSHGRVREIGMCFGNGGKSQKISIRCDPQYK